VLTGVALAVPFVQPAQAASSFDWVSQAYTGGSTDNLDNNLAQKGVSDNGRYVLFLSGATNVVPNDTNDHRDLFVRDRQTGTNTLVSVSTAGVQANQDTYIGSISGDGRYVVFSTTATNLAATGDNNTLKVFVRDLQNNTTSLVCTSIYNLQCVSSDISRDGRYILYNSYDPFNQYQLYRYDQTSGNREIVSYGPSGYANSTVDTRAAMTPDGRYVVFMSTATNLVANDTNGKTDIFKRDMQTGTMSRISTTASNAQSNGDSEWPSISDNGRYVVFYSLATNFTATHAANWTSYLKDTTGGSIQLVSGAPLANDAFITGNGLYVIFATNDALSASDTDTNSDVYIWNRGTNTNTRVSEDSSGNALSGGTGTTGFATPDGRYVPLMTSTSIDPNDTNDGSDIYLADMGAGFLDTTRPTIAFTAPASFAGPFATGPTVSVAASDSGSGLASLVIHVYNSSNQLLNICGSANATQLAAGSLSCDLSSLANGTYSIKAGTFDNAGNNKTITSGTFTIGQ